MMFSVTASTRPVRTLSRSPCRAVSSWSARSPRRKILPAARLAAGQGPSPTIQGFESSGRRFHPCNPWTVPSCQSLRWSSSSPLQQNASSSDDVRISANHSHQWRRGGEGGLSRSKNLFHPSIDLTPQKYRVPLMSQSMPPGNRYYSFVARNIAGSDIASSWPRQDLRTSSCRVGHPCVTIRSLSTNNGKDSKDETDGSSTDKNAKDETSSSTDSETSKTDSPSSRISEASKAVRQRVEQVEERLSKVLHDVVAVSTGDQLAVAAIAVLLVGLVAAPYVISQMKASNRNYDNLADTDDPVDDFTQLAKEEWDSPDAAKRVSALENLLSEVAQSKALKQAAQQFVIQLVEAPEVKAALQRLLFALWKDLVEDPETVKQVINLLSVAIADEQVKAAAQQLVLDLVAEPEVQASLVTAVEKLGVDPEVEKTLEVLLSSSAHNTLNDAEVLDHSMEFATDVLGDDVVQQTAGEALRNTVRHAFRPAATMSLTATGVGLMLFGILALGYARSSEYEAQLLDTAARSLQANAVYGLQRLFTWPARVLGGSLTWIRQGIVHAWLALTSAVAHNTGRLGQWTVRGVSRTGASLGGALGQSWHSLWTSTWGAVHFVWTAAFRSVLGLAQGTLRSIQHAWTTSNASLLQWSWDVVLWGNQLGWRVLVWLPRAVGKTSTWRSLQVLWQRLTSQIVGLW